MKSLKLLAAAAAASALASPASAVVIDVYQGTLGAFSYTVVGNTITINETWTNTNPVFLRFNELGGGDWVIVKNIINNTGTTFTTFANELFDPDGDGNDALDPKPQPLFIPKGWTTSNDGDGLSFAQGSGIPRTSTAFGTVVADELSDARDFLDFINGSAPSGSAFSVTYGLRDSGPNQPFLLGQRANVRSAVPEPATWGMLILGFLGMGSVMRKRNRIRYEGLKALA